VSESTVRVVVEPLAGGLHPLESSWRALDERSDRPSPYLTYDWMAAWLAVYQPPRVALVRALEREGGTVGLGLIEQLAGGRWRFAGRPVTPVRGLQTLVGYREALWSSFGRWLRQHPRDWATLDAEGLVTPPSLPRLRLAAVANPRVDLADSFDEYLADRSPTTRKGLKRKLRRGARAGAAVVEVAPSDRERVLEVWLRLHRLRAEAKGELHPGMEPRVGRLLHAVEQSERLRLRVFELRAEGRTAGASVRIDHGGTAHFYNSGFDPRHGSISPGILLELASIRQAIEEGLHTFDLGPTDYRYKHDLGGDHTTVLRAEAASPAPRGPAVRALTEAYVGTRRYLGRRRRIRTPAAEAARNKLARGSSLAHMLPVRGLPARSSSRRGAPRSAAETSASSHR
jgi:CelD/BcsL family acetyltransferase involved in cellulose biosynthesis